ncbi:HNH endonuclease [Chryseobacterium sp. 6424]|uniref:HNH endonuclease n=1 Tax=Chryseobacterium sp. 6424 TaxID=2039166 RepID=UPI001E61CE4C|nr:HNH endonuclease [Chryseobacterium sp. 6424]
MRTTDISIFEVFFDEDDRQIFLCDDLQLKADALRNSILPKFDVITNEIIKGIIEIYEIDFFENLSIVKSPHFRKSKEQRKDEVKKDYQYCGVGISGKRADNKWFGLDKGTNKVPKINLTTLYLTIGSTGFQNVLRFNHPKNFTEETYKKFFDFFIYENESIVNLLLKANMSYGFYYSSSLTVYQDLMLKFSKKNYDVVFYKPTVEYPLDNEKIVDAILSNIIIFPILNACIQISLGNEHNFEEDLRKLSSKIYDFSNSYQNEKPKEIKDLSEEEMLLIKEKAEQKIKIVAGIRWQVFKRDNWKCVSCGKSSFDDVILHIDHIIPRSLGGKDDYENFQTLCSECNIGKSNKDTTNLRKYNNASS